MRIMILGAAGFIGTNLTNALLKDSRNSITLVDRNSESLNRVYRGRHSLNLIADNLNNDTDFDKLLIGQEVIYHLVSTTVPTTSNQHIPKEISENVELTSKLLEACVRCKVKRIIFLSSGGTVYGSSGTCPLKEEVETQPINSYGVQKVMIEKLLHLYQYMYGLEYRIIRLANPYGPYQNPNGIQGAVTTFIYRALKNEDIVVYGDGSVIRDYLYIDDAIKAIINVANYGGIERIFNVGSGEGTSISEVLEEIEKTLSKRLKINYKPARKVDIPINYLNVSKYENEFGKIKFTSLSEGIKRTTNFFEQTNL